MFTLGTEDLQYIFEQAGQSVIVNDAKINVIVTNPPVDEYEQRYIHSLQKVSRGDIVTLEGEKYISITESITKRGSKYKTLIRHLNATIKMKGEPTEIQIGENPYTGEPIYEYIEGEDFYIAAIVDNKSFSVNFNQPIILPNNQIEVIVQDNEINRSLFASGKDFSVIEKTWTVLNQDLSKSGLLILTCDNKM
ncbi:hypothetical protein [Peribacillus asahii]|uniref:hypothetical protein n=1 Tax=Peribacillus asahii TaxID=228899 RepID=UPI002079AAED|nr:hypothetical protein [Peribacillus asahii]USK86176.1 hypothetical protein LIT35_05910 [Peribacillus asahii]